MTKWLTTAASSIFPSSASSCLSFLHSPLIFLLWLQGLLLCIPSSFLQALHSQLLAVFISVIASFPQVDHSFNTQILLREKAVFVSFHYLSWLYSPLPITPSTLPGLYSPASLITLSPSWFPSPLNSLGMLMTMMNPSLYSPSHYSGLLFTQLLLLPEHSLTIFFWPHL